MAVTSSGKNDKSPVPRRKLPRAGKVAGVSWMLYHQAAAAYAAIGLAHMLNRYWHIQWHGLLATMMELWNAARAAVAGLLHGLVTVPAGWLGAEVVTPLWIRDYLAVGITLALSYVRSNRVRTAGPELHSAMLPALFQSMENELHYAVRFIYGYPINDGEEVARGWRIRLIKYATPIVAAYIIVLWPLALATAMYSLVGRLSDRPRFMRYPDYRGNPDVDEKGWFKSQRRTLVSLLVALAPFVYLALILAANFWVMPYMS